ncbi:MAG: hypothetical protein OSJ83_04275 [Clostridia bacterium]|nr:hypothetical protein [Clostridia bacterium]
MKKKLLTVMLAVVLTLGCFAGLLACNGDGDNAALDPEKVASEKVADAEAWAKAFDYSEMTNGTIKVTMKSSNENRTRETVSDVLIDSDKIYQDGTRTTKYAGEDAPETVVYKGYIVKDGDSCYTCDYYEDRDKFIKREFEPDYFDFTVEDFVKSHIDGIRFNSFENFSDFTYNDDKGAYIASVEMHGDTYGVEIKIINGKARYIKIAYNGEDESEFMSLYICDIGETVITLPPEDKIIEE